MGLAYVTRTRPRYKNKKDSQCRYINVCCSGELLRHIIVEYWASGIFIFRVHIEDNIFVPCLTILVQFPSRTVTSSIAISPERPPMTPSMTNWEEKIIIWYVFNDILLCVDLHCWTALGSPPTLLRCSASKKMSGAREYGFFIVSRTVVY